MNGEVGGAARTQGIVQVVGLQVVVAEVRLDGAVEGVAAAAGDQR